MNEVSLLLLATLTYNNQQFNTKGALIEALGVKRYHNLLRLVAVHREIVATGSKYIRCSFADKSLKISDTKLAEECLAFGHESFGGPAYFMAASEDMRVEVEKKTEKKS